MRGLILAAMLGVAGCAVQGVEVVAQTDTMIALRVANGPHLQEVENAASRYCAERGLAPHLTNVSSNQFNTMVRYECVSRPK